MLAPLSRPRHLASRVCGAGRSLEFSHLRERTLAEALAVLRWQPGGDIRYSSNLEEAEPFEVCKLHAGVPQRLKVDAGELRRGGVAFRIAGADLALGVPAQAAFESVAERHRNPHIQLVA